jgi:Phage tail protein
MAKWDDLRKIRGVRTSPFYYIATDTGSGHSVFTWNETVPQGSTYKLEANVSYDGGYNWEGWKAATKDVGLPDFSPLTKSKATVFQYRFIGDSTTVTSLPLLHDLTLTITPTYLFVNNGDMPCRPEIWIEKIGNGDFSIINRTNNNQEFKFVNILDRELLYIDCEREHIETDINMKYRYDNFNNQYLELVTGNNVLEFKGKFKVMFRYQFKTLQG